jgi:glycerophosphoryl diester phosphodiesterase
MNKTKIILIFIVALIYSCDNNIKPKIIGHRAYGVKGFNDTIMDNTLDAIKKALPIVDGIEVDIQMSLDGTIWLYHDQYFITPDSSFTSIVQMNDKDVVKHLYFLHPGVQFSTLAEVLEYFKDNKINKPISLDIKNIFNKKIYEKGYASRDYLNKLIDRIIYLAKKNNVDDLIFVEANSSYFLNTIKEKSKIKTFYLGFTEFQKNIDYAIENNYSGISQNYNDPGVNYENIQYAKKHKLIIQLWTPNTEQDLKKVFLLNPDYIQTDHVNFKPDSILF